MIKGLPLGKPFLRADNIRPYYLVTAKTLFPDRDVST